MGGKKKVFDGILVFVYIYMYTNSIGETMGHLQNCTLYLAKY